MDGKQTGRTSKKKANSDLLEYKVEVGCMSLSVRDWVSVLVFSVSVFSGMTEVLAVIAGSADGDFVFTSMLAARASSDGVRDICYGVGYVRYDVRHIR